MNWLKKQILNVFSREEVIDKAMAIAVREEDYELGEQLKKFREKSPEPETIWDFDLNGWIIINYE